MSEAVPLRASENEWQEREERILDISCLIL